MQSLSRRQRNTIQLRISNAVLQAQNKAAQRMMQQFADGVAMASSIASGSGSVRAPQVPALFTPAPGASSDPAARRMSFGDSDM